MFRGKCLSTLLFLTVLSISWAAPEPGTGLDINSGNNSIESNSTELDSRKDMYYKAANLAGSVFESALYIVTFGGSLASAPNSNVMGRLMASIADYLPGVTSGTLLADGTTAFGHWANSIKNVWLYNQMSKLVLPVKNDFVCGMITLSLEDGWFIVSLRVNQGSIQNDSQYFHKGDNIYIAKNIGLTNLLMVKQMTGWLSAGNMHRTENPPVDFHVKVSNGIQHSTILVQKSACTLHSYGPVTASVVEGDDISFCLTNPNSDPNANIASTKVTSAYGTPALMRIPGELCENSIQ